MNIYMTPKHKTFISFHSADNYYKNFVETQWAEQFHGFVSRSVRDGDIKTNLPTEYTRQLIRDNFISDATITLVLVGKGTWRRKHVDWEIASSLRATKNNSRTGLLGVLLPTYSVHTPQMMFTSSFRRTENGGFYNPYTIPPRLHDNIECGFAKIYSWSNSPYHLRQWIHDAFQRRKNSLPNNKRDGYRNNRSETQTHWRD